MSILNKQLKIFAISKSLFGVFVIVALSLFATGFVYSANTYYDIDANGGAGEIVVNHNQSINGITELGDGGTANYAQFSATGNLLFTGSANQISKTDGALTITTTAQDLTISTTTTGNLAITSAGNITETIAEGSTYTLTDGSVNFLKVTSTRDIEVGATLVSGSFEFTEDSGLSTLVDMPVSATAATAQGYVFKIDGDNIMTIYSTADGSGGIENKRIGIGTTAPGGLLELEKSYAGGATARTWSIVDGDIATTDQTADMIGLDINLSTGAVDLAGSANAYGLKVDVDGIDDQSSGGAYAAAFMGGNVGIGILTPSVALHVAGQCVTADTRLRRRRKKKAGEIADEEAGEWEDSEYVYDQVMIKDIQPGDEIASMNPITGELVYSQVEGLMNMGQKVVYKLVTQSGREIKTTENHPYFVRTKYEEPIARPNQKLVKFEVDQSIKIEEFNKDSVVAIANKENSFAVVVPRKVKQTLRDTLRKNQTQKFNAVVFATAIVKAIDKIDAIVNELAIDMEYVGYEKVIANVIAKVFPQIQINFTQVGKKSPAHFVAYKVYKKEKTADYIADINDIVSQTKNALRWSFLPNPQGAESPDTPRTLLITNSLDDNKKLVKGGVWAKVKGLKVGQMIAVTHGDKVVWERIMEIKQLPIEKVYDIEVQGTHNFVANDIIAHNTYLGSDLTIYEDANDADVRLNMGTSATERVSIQSLNATGTKTLEQVLFQTDTASATADYGKFRFNVDGTDILQIDDSGIEMFPDKILTGNVTGDLTGNVTGDVSGSSGSCTGNSATVTNGVYTTNNLSVMSATTSAQLAGVISDETGTDKLVYNTSPTLITPALGTPTALVGTNITGTASNLTAGAVSNATLTTALTVDTGALTLTANNAGTSVLTIGAGAVSVLGSNTGDQDLSGKANVDQTMYIGTTGVAINRATNALTLAGITLTAPDIGTPSAGNLANCTFPTLNQNTTGSAATLTTARTINGISFNGSSNITVTANAETLSGATLKSTVLASPLTSVGTLTSLTTSGNITIAGNYIGRDADNTLSFATDNQIDLKTNGTTKLSIASDGTLTINNNTWLTATANGGGTINMMKVNSSDAIEVGGTLVSGSFEFTEDSGLSTLVDMPVSATPAVDTAQGYVFKIDGDNIMTIYAEADSAGGIQDKGVGIGITTPSRRLDVLDTTANIPQLRLTHDNTTYGEFYIDATGDLSISLTDSADGDDIRILNENLWVCSGGTFASPACPSVSLSDVGNLVVEGKIYENTTALEDKYVMAASAGAADYPCYGHYGCHAATNYTTCYVDPNNPDNASCWTNDTLASLTKAAESVSCGSEMAKIIDTKYGAGVFCIDRWEAYDAGANTAGSARNQTAKISISQTDAATFCTNAGKHLCTSQEWLSACNYGSYNFATIDDHGGTATAPCNTGSSAKIPTGTYNHCHTTDWVYDMVGNVWEWTDAGLTVDNPDASWSAGHSSSGDGIGYYTDDDGYWFSTNTGRAFIRGGGWSNGGLDGCFAVALSYAPEGTYTSIGFRCCQ